MTNKTYIGIIRDRSSSMIDHTKNAINDYNSQIDIIKQKMLSLNQDIIVSVYDFADYVNKNVVNSSAITLKQITNYESYGYTRLYDTIGEMITDFEKLPDYDNNNVSFLILILTDGEENRSISWDQFKLANKIKELNKTEKWTIVFRVPKGYKITISGLNIPKDNIIEWDVNNTKKLETSTNIQTKSIDNYLTARSTGVRKSTTFFTNTEELSTQKLKKELDDITSQLVSWQIQTPNEAREISSFVEHKTGKKFKPGTCFHSLTNKRKNEISPDKQIIIKNKKTKKYYFGDINEIKELLKLPQNVKIKVEPESISNFEIFIQSKSYNRKLVVGTELLYWEKYTK